MQYLVAIDSGTSSTRAVLYSTCGQVIKQSQYPLSLSYPQHGWVEQNPEEIWKKTCLALEAVTQGIACSDIVACGVTNQRETTILWDKQTGECVAPAIVWQDRRTAEFCHGLADAHAFIHERTGLLPDAYFSATKIRWLIHHIPSARALLKSNRLAFGTIDSFLIWRLTNGREHLTDITNASRTMLFNINDQQWDTTLLDFFELPESILPEVRACDSHFGVMELPWMDGGIAITGVAGDQQAALIGQNCFTAGEVKATYGTGGFIMMNTGNKPVYSSQKLLSTVAYRLQDETAYAIEGNINQAGTLVKWLRDELRLIEHAYDSQKLAASISTNDGVYFVPTFTGLGAPHWLDDNGAMFVGLSQKTGRAHMVRAVLESICYQTRDILDCLHDDIGVEKTVLRADGGMVVNSWFMQYLANQCACVIERPRDIETTALGVAMVAGLGCGLFSSLEQTTQLRQVDECFESDGDQQTSDFAYQGWQQVIRGFKQYHQ